MLRAASCLRAGAGLAVLSWGWHCQLPVSLWRYKPELINSVIYHEDWFYQLWPTSTNCFDWIFVVCATSQTCHLRHEYSNPQKKVYTLVEPSTQKWGGARWKVGGAPNPRLSWSKLGQASFWNLLLCRHLLEFQNESWSSLDQLKGRCDAPPTFPLALHDFENLALPQVNTFFRWRLYVCPFCRHWVKFQTYKCSL